MQTEREHHGDIGTVAFTYIKVFSDQFLTPFAIPTQNYLELDHLVAYLTNHGCVKILFLLYLIQSR